MKKIFISILAFALIIGTVFCLGSCGAKVEYDNSDKFTPGPWESNLLIPSIDIEWPKGKVEIVSHPYWYVTCAESSEGDISGDFEMHCYYDDMQTLLIKPSANGASLDALPEKTLTVYVPMGYSFNDIDIRTDSAEVVISDSCANFCDIKTVSGNINVSFLGRSQDLEIETESGEVKLFASVKNKLEISSATADVTVQNKYVPTSTMITTASGNVSLALPGDGAFTATVKSDLGSTEISFEGVENNGKTVVNNGTSPVDIISSSGNIEIIKSK